MLPQESQESGEVHLQIEVLPLGSCQILWHIIPGSGVHLTVVVVLENSDTSYILHGPGPSSEESSRDIILHGGAKQYHWRVCGRPNLDKS